MSATAGLEDSDDPHIMLRRTFNPHTEPEQPPIAIVFGDRHQRLDQEVGVLNEFFSVNGVGKRSSSTPFITAAPSAILLGSSALSRTDWFRNRYQSCIQDAGVDLWRSVRGYRTHGTDLWARAADEVREALASFGLDEPHAPVAQAAPPDPDEDLFDEYWSIATSPEMTEATVEALGMAWFAFDQGEEMEFEFVDVEVFSWLRLFLREEETEAGDGVDEE